jgi:hypothetical protein
VISVSVKRSRRPARAEDEAKAGKSWWRRLTVLAPAAAALLAGIVAVGSNLEVIANWFPRADLSATVAHCLRDEIKVVIENDGNRAVRWSSAQLTIQNPAAPDLPIELHPAEEGESLEAKPGEEMRLRLRPTIGGALAPIRVYPSPCKLEIEMHLTRSDPLLQECACPSS